MAKGKSSVTDRRQKEVFGRCTNCNAALVVLTQRCVDCDHDLGYPNVRLALQPEEAHSLKSRVDLVRKELSLGGKAEALDELISNVTTNSYVVIAVPPAAALTMLDKSTSVYQNYEQLVGSGTIVPASFANDAHRRAVAGLFFAHFSQEIRYAALTMSMKGLTNYGMVVFRIRDVTIRDRTSFLHENSYGLARALGLTPSQPVPPGYRSDWAGRGELVAAKLGAFLAKEPLESVLNRLLIEGADRTTDEFIEAHIYGGFTRGAFEDIKLNPKSATKSEKRMMGLIQELFRQHRGAYD